MSAEGNPKAKEAGEGKPKKEAGEGKPKKEAAAKPKKEGAEGKPKAKEPQVDVKGFVQKANGAELLQLARQTGLIAHALVKNYDKPEAADYFQKEQDLRRLMYLQQKNHADFRNRLGLLLMKKQPPAP